MGGGHKGRQDRVSNTFPSGADTWAPLLRFLDLVDFASFDLHKYFLRFGPCLNELIGGSSK